MGRKKLFSDPHINRRIIGFSLPVKVASDVKAEAARRKITLRELFLEMWSRYQEKSP
jgi:hypothetical protein